MGGIAEDLASWCARGDRMAVATVVATRRAAPRSLGTKAGIFEPSATAAGSGSGVSARDDLCWQVEMVLRTGTPTLLDVGPPCGGGIKVLIQPLTLSSLDQTLKTVAAGETAGELTVMEHRHTGLKLLLTTSGDANGESIRGPARWNEGRTPGPLGLDLETWKAIATSPIDRLRQSD